MGAASISRPHSLRKVWEVNVMNSEIRNARSNSSAISSTFESSSAVHSLKEEIVAGWNRRRSVAARYHAPYQTVRGGRLVLGLGAGDVDERHHGSSTLKGQ